MLNIESQFAHLFLYLATKLLIMKKKVIIEKSHVLLPGKLLQNRFLQKVRKHNTWFFIFFILEIILDLVLLKENNRKKKGLSVFCNIDTCHYLVTSFWYFFESNNPIIMSELANLTYKIIASN